MVSGRSREKATSSVVSSEPSWNLTPLRSVNSQVRESGLRHVASTGTARPRSSTWSSDSKTWCAAVRFGCAATKWGSKVVTSAERPMRNSAALAATANNSPAATTQRRMNCRDRGPRTRDRNAMAGRSRDYRSPIPGTRSPGFELVSKGALVRARVVSDAAARCPQVVLVVEGDHAEVADAELGGLLEE